MNAPARSNAFDTANPHALATILEASETKRIIASQDIFDISGIKLWARDQPVSAALQRKLLDRKLRNPLESCLMAEDGVTPATLAEALQSLLEGGSALAALLQPHASRLLSEVRHLPLHPVVQLLLTAGQASRPESFGHALQGMALAGALMAGKGGSVAEVRVAMLGGLLHDLGEMYIDPRFGEADAERRLDFVSYQQLVVHPHVGQLILSQLTNYPAALSRAVGEHHERLDGSGYPHGLQREAVSTLGRLLAVTEGALMALGGDRSGLARASVALRAVPGEYDLSWVGRIAEAARARPDLGGVLDRHEVHFRLGGLDKALSAALAQAGELLPEAETPALKDALGLAGHLLQRLRLGWNASGLWSDEVVADQDAAEVEAVEDELFHRLAAIDRAARLRAGELPEADAQRLEQLCAVLALVGRG